MELVNIKYSGVGNTIENLSTADQSLITSNYINSQFGNTDDYLELYIYDEYNQLVLVDYDATDYYPYLSSNPKNNTFSNISLNPELDLKNRGFNRGVLNIQYNFYKTLFNSKQNLLYWIKEISISRTEIRLASQTISDLDIKNGFAQYQNYVSNKNYYPIFYLNFGNNQIVVANNVAYTEDEEGSYLVIKLYDPLPTEFDLKSQLWIIDKVAESVNFTVDIKVESDNLENLNELRGPNYNITLNSKNGQTTPYYNYDSLLTSPVTSSYQKLLSYYQDKSVAINVDYTDFKNFIHFSSATERVNNFVYKLQLIETYNAQQNNQNLISGGSQNIQYASSSINIAQQSINNIIEKFDPYEYFLYFDTSEYAWPKSTTTQPYQLYSVTSSEASNFLGSSEIVPTYSTQSILFSASYYDTTNKDLLRNSIPQYILDDDNNQPYITFIDMVGQHFDNIWLYYKDISNRYNNTNNPETGISLDVVADALKGFGVELYTNSNVSDNLYYTLFGINQDGSLLPPTGSEIINEYVTSSISTLPAQNIQKELYKRLYHNLPYLLKSKGTERSIKTLISCFGIPDDILTVKEFGGTPINSIDGIYDLDSSDYKIAITTGSSGVVTGSEELGTTLLSPYTSIQYYENSSRLNNTNIEVGFSPADIINNNITGSLGYFNIDQLIGNPNDQYSSSYTNLVSQSNDYFSTYNKPSSIWEYIRLIKFYNNSLFKMIKDYAPARSNVSTGIIVKSHILERNKYARNEPDTQYENNLSQSIDSAFISSSNGGSITKSTNCNYLITTPIGIVPYTSSNGIEKYNGELGGLEIIATDGSSFNQYEISNLLSTASNQITYSLGALYQNITSSVKSIYLLDLDYNSNQTKPVNYGLVTKSLDDSQVNNYADYNNPMSPYAQVQDYNYFLQRSIIPRYIGSYVESANYNDYTQGDISYGKNAAIDKIKYQYGYLVDVYSSSFQLPGRSNAQIKYIIDNNENILNLTKTNINIFEVQNIFKSSDSIDISFFDYDPSNADSQYLTNNSNVDVYKGGFRYSPILYNPNSSSILNYRLSSPILQTSSVFIPGGEVLTIEDGVFAKNNWDRFVSKFITTGGVWNYTINTGSPNSGTPSNATEKLRVIIKATKKPSAPPNWSDLSFTTDVLAGQPAYISLSFVASPPNSSDVVFNEPYIDQVYRVTIDPGTNSTSQNYVRSINDSHNNLILIEPNRIQLSLSQSVFYNNLIQSENDTFSSDPYNLEKVVFPLELQKGDMIRLYNYTSSWGRTGEYTINEVNTSYNGFVSFTVDRDVNYSDTKDFGVAMQDAYENGPSPTYGSGSVIESYVILKLIPDETNIILDFNSTSNIQSDGILFPKYIDEAVKLNSGNIIKSLTQQNLLPGGNQTNIILQ